VVEGVWQITTASVLSTGEAASVWNLECGDVTPLSFVSLVFHVTVEPPKKNKKRETKESGVTSPHSKFQTLADWSQAKSLHGVKILTVDSTKKLVRTTGIRPADIPSTITIAVSWWND
jgi:hypothetical protein